MKRRRFYLGRWFFAWGGGWKFRWKHLSPPPPPPVREEYWIERENGERIDGPFPDEDLAFAVRVELERIHKPETFWIRSGSWSDAERVWRGGVG